MYPLISNAACTLTASPSTVNTRSIATLTIDPLNTFPSDGQIVIDTVGYWTRDISNSTKIFNLSTTLQCNSVTNTASNIHCVVTETVDLQTTNTITVTNVVSSDTTGAMVFTMAPVVTPPSIEPQGSWTISTRSSSGGRIDSCTNVKMTGTTAGTLTSAGFAMASTVVNTQGQANITFKLSTTIVTSDTISIIFPSGFGLSVTSVVITPGNRQILNPVVSGQVLSFTGMSATQSTQLTVMVTSVTNPP